MDKLSKLQKLLGEENVVDTTAFEGWGVPQTPRHLYEGTDSDSDMIREADVIREPITSKSKNQKKKNVASNVAPQKIVRRSENKTNAKKYSLELGQIAAEEEFFCPWRAVKDYPWKFIGQSNRDKVVATFYEANQFADEEWDFFYIHRGTTDLNQHPVILVPTHQFESFLQTINDTLGIELHIPLGGSNAGFRLQFYNDGNPRPRYLGHSTNANMANALHKNIPPSYFKMDGELDALGTPSARSLAAFKKKMEDMVQFQKNKKTANAEKKKRDRMDRQKAWCHSLKRIQRYLGLRKLMEVDADDIENELNLWGNRVKGDYDEAIKAARAKLGSCASFDAMKLAPYETEADVVFVCVDIEAYERNSKVITEIGIATLDTRDLKVVIPGKLGENWMSKIRARHFRIKEHAHFNNTEFVDGCADKFGFGESEFISLKDAPRFIASCFKPPFSGATSAIEEDQVKRNVILVGHDTPADIAFMQQLGYNVHNLSNLQEIADTASMWRYVKREINPRNLGMILYELDINGWHLHNAGNDAVYTLQAMIGIAIKHIEDKNKIDKENMKKARISDSMKEATELALEKEEGWSSSGENSDGGCPVSPEAPPPRPHHAPGTSKQAVARAVQPSPAIALPIYKAAPNPTPDPEIEFKSVWGGTATGMASPPRDHSGWHHHPTASSDVSLPGSGSDTLKSKSWQHVALVPASSLVTGMGNLSLEEKDGDNGKGKGKETGKERRDDIDYNGW